MATHFMRDIREIPLKVINRRVGDEHVTLLQACYDNPLFVEQENNKAYNGGKAVSQESKTSVRAKDYIHTLPQQHEVKFKSSKCNRKKRLWIIAFVVFVFAVVGVLVGLLAHFLGEIKSTQQLQTTSLPVISHSDQLKGSLRIIKGPFSVYTKSLEDTLSPAYRYLAQSFHFKMNTIFQESSFKENFNSSEIILVSRGSVVLNFVIHLHKPVAVTDTMLQKVKGLILVGMANSLMVIEESSLKIFVDAILPISTLPTPSENCEVVRLAKCVNLTDYTLTAFPNFMGHVNQEHAQSASEQYKDLFNSQCYGYSTDFWCNIWVPPCVAEKPLPPCKQYCQDVYSHCVIQSQDNNSWPVKCSSFPDSTNPLVCRQNPFKIAAGTCVAMKSEPCRRNGQNYTTFPNIVGNVAESSATFFVQLLETIQYMTQCYRHTMTFACAAFIPKCSENPLVPYNFIPPCKSLCLAYRERCELFMEIFKHSWPEKLNCTELPDTPDTNVCIGYKEANEPSKYDDCEKGELRCDENVCIPQGWVCDGYQDCADNQDEKHCATCGQEEFSCTPVSTQCIPKSFMCDGKKDCFESVDEAECAKLTMDENYYKLKVFNRLSERWEEVCADGWNETHSDIVCRQLGYRKVSSTLLAPGSGKPTMVLRNRSQEADPKLIQSYLARNNCSASLVVKLLCEDPICGIRPAHHPSLLRIVNGDEAKPGSWPWLLSIHGGKDEKFFCGASIINENWVMTAAHCVGGGSNNLIGWTLKAGATRRNTFSRHRQVRKVKRLIVYPKYVEVDHDIALIQVSQPFIFTDYVRPICLPKQGEEPIVGRKCVAAGWGKPSEKAADYMRSTQQLYMDIVDWQSCRDAFEASKKEVYEITKNMFCAGGTIDHDACAGDSGGPFVCRKQNSSDEWEQVGIVSWGLGCAVPNIPGIYTVVTNYIEWIKKTISSYDDHYLES